MTSYLFTKNLSGPTFHKHCQKFIAMMNIQRKGMESRHICECIFKS